MKGYHLIIQMEVGVNARKTSGAFLKGEEQADIIKEALSKLMPVGEVKVFLKRPGNAKIKQHES